MMMRILCRYLKISKAFLIVICFIFTLSLIRAFKRKGLKRRLLVGHIVRYFSEKMVKALNIHIRIQGKFSKNDNFLIVCNHLSHLDIIILHSILKNTCFIAARDIMERKIVGTLIKHGNVYGIERKNKSRIKKDIKEMARLLNNRFDLLMFPEGRTSNAEHVLRFKEPLFQSAVLFNKKVLPVTLNYLSVDKEPFSLKNRDMVCWYRRKFSFLQHFIKFCNTQSITVELIIGSPISSHNETSKSLSLKAREAVVKHFKPVRKKSTAIVRFQPTMNDRLAG